MLALVVFVASVAVPLLKLLSLTALLAKAASIGWNRPTPEMPTQPGSLGSLQEQLLAVAEALQGTLQRTDRLIEHIDQDIVPELAPTLRDSRSSASICPSSSTALSS